MLKNRDIVIVGLQPWDIQIGSNCKNIAIELSRHNRVLYVNPAIDRWTVLKRSSDELVKRRKEVIRKQRPPLVQVGANIWNLSPTQMAESVNWIQPTGIFKWANRVNNRRLANDILDAMNDLHFSNIILFNDQSMVRCFNLKEMLSPSVFIYYIRDNLASIPYFRKHGMEMEHQLIATADVVVANSMFLTTYAQQYNPRATFIGQGCDFSLYEHPDELMVAAEMLPFARPVIGYTGSLTAARLDIDLLAHLAERHPEWQLVLVGPEDGTFRASRLHGIENVHFLGKKHPDMLPSYIKSFDVAINPQIVNEITMGNYPRKIDEYLALGKPVVATFTPFMEYFHEHTYLAHTREEFAAKIAQALAEDNQDRAESRRAYALTHSWEANVNAISALIEQKDKSLVEAGN